MNMNAHSYQSPNKQSSRCPHIPELPQNFNLSEVSDLADIWISRKTCKHCGAEIVPSNSLMWLVLLHCFLLPISGVGVYFLLRSVIEWQSLSVSQAVLVSVCLAVFQERVIIHRCYTCAPWITVSQAEIVVKGKRYDIRSIKAERWLTFAALIMGALAGFCLYIIFR